MIISRLSLTVINAMGPNTSELMVRKRLAGNVEVRCCALFGIVRHSLDAGSVCRLATAQVIN